MYEKNYSIIIDAFDDNKKFLQEFFNAFKIIINTKLDILHMPGLLDIHINMIMKGMIKLSGDENVNKIFDTIINIFKLLDDKDIFYKAYQKSFSKRLISGSYNQDLESTFINKMKNFSFDSLIKSIEIMYNDILISQDFIFLLLKI